MCAPTVSPWCRPSRACRAQVRRGTAIEDVDAGPGGAYARLEDAGHRLGHFEERVATRMPAPAELSALQLPPGASVLVIMRVACTGDGQAVEVNG